MLVYSTLKKTCNCFAFIFSIFVGSLYAQERVDITTCDATSSGVVCISPTDSLYELCVKLKPGPCSSKVYEVDWGDDKNENVTLNSEVTIKHVYDLKNSFKSCSVGLVRFNINVGSATCLNDNKGFRVTFNKKPVANPAVGAACEGLPVRFLNNSCSTSSDVSFLWDFGNGQTSTAFSPSINYSDPTKTYKAKLTATSQNCGTSTAEVDVKLKKLPEAKYVLTSGFSLVNGDTVICLSNGGTLTLDATLSIDATRYQWTVSPRDYRFINGTNASSPKPVIQFSKAGVYTVTLVAENDCGRSKPNPCPHTVIDKPTLNLPRQVDVCQAPFRYRFISQTGVSYTLNGRAFDPAVGEELAFQTAPYIVEATIPNPCGGVITDRDTFLVSAASQVKITTPIRDTTLCLGTANLSLRASSLGGTWSGSALIESQGTNRVFNPKTLGRYLIRYVVGSGSCSSKDSVTVVVEGIQPDARDLTVCQGGTLLKLQATPLGGRWTGCSNCLRGGDTLIISAVPANQIKLTYEVTSPSGCRSTDEAVISIGRPKADFSITNGCTGSALRPTNNSTGASTYTWLVNNNQVASGAVPSLSLAAGTNRVTLIAGAGGCADTTTRDVLIIAPPPNADFSLSQTQGCAPLTVSFIPTGAPNSASDYTWTLGDGTQHRGFTPPAKQYENTERAAKDFTVTLSVTNACGEQRASKSVNVRPRAKAEIGVDSTTVRCTPALITFSNRSTGHNKPLTRWSFGDGSMRVSGADTLKHWFSARDSSRTYRVKVAVTSDCGQDSATVDIRVHPNLVKPLFELSKSIVCPGEPIQVKDATVPKPERWVWKFGDGKIDTRPNATHAFSQPNRDYRITLIAYTACGFDSTSKIVKVDSLPKGDFRLESPMACQGQPVRFVNLSDSRLGVIWDFGDGSPLDSVTYSPLHTYTTTANSISATLTVYRGSTACKGAPIRKTVPILARTVANFSIEGDSLLCSPGPVRFINRSQNADTFKWYFSDGRTADTPNPILPFPKGQYDVKLVVSNRGVCKDSTFRMSAFQTDSCSVVIPQAFTPNNDGIGDRFTLFGNGIKEIIWLRIRDRWGEVVFEVKNIPAGSQNEEQSWDGTFNGRAMPADMYVLESEVMYLENRKRERLRGNFYLMR